jgi:CRP/FNR family transcriptional regulator, cyclic AMP receptor protein
MQRFHRNDALNYLPRRPLLEYAKGETIYSGRSEGLHMVAYGHIKISIASETGFAPIIRIVPPEGLFGESSLLAATTRERAVALDEVQLMSWTRAEIEQQIDQEPSLALALIHQLVRDRLTMQERIHCMAACKASQRVQLSLIQLAETLGNPQPDGTLRMAALTHHMIAAYVGTSREIVSTQMSRLRRLGLVRYSRKFIDVESEAIRESLQNNGFPVLALRAFSAAT